MKTFLTLYLSFSLLCASGSHCPFSGLHHPPLPPAPNSPSPCLPSVMVHCNAWLWQHLFFLLAPFCDGILELVFNLLVTQLEWAVEVDSLTLLGSQLLLSCGDHQWDRWGAWWMGRYCTAGGSARKPTACLLLLTWFAHGFSPDSFAELG